MELSTVCSAVTKTQSYVFATYDRGPLYCGQALRMVGIHALLAMSPERVPYTIRIRLCLRGGSGDRRQYKQDSDRECHVSSIISANWCARRNRRWAAFSLRAAESFWRGYPDQERHEDRVARVERRPPKTKARRRSAAYQCFCSHSSTCLHR